MPTLHVYFAYGSSYSYLAWARITKVYPERYQDVEVLWHPVQFGKVLALQGHDGSAPANLANYSRTDTQRWAESYGLPMRFPASYPIDSAVCARAHLLAEMEGPQRERSFMRALFEAHWEQGVDISRLEVLEQAAADCGVPALHSRLAGAGVDRLLEANVRDAVTAGAPGMPYFVLDGEGYWGNDRLAWVEYSLGHTAPWP